MNSSVCPSGCDSEYIRYSLSGGNSVTRKRLWCSKCGWSEDTWSGPPELVEKVKRDIEAAQRYMERTA